MFLGICIKDNKGYYLSPLAFVIVPITLGLVLSNFYETLERSNFNKEVEDDSFLKD